MIETWSMRLLEKIYYITSQLCVLIMLEDFHYITEYYTYYIDRSTIINAFTGLRIGLKLRTYKHYENNVDEFCRIINEYGLDSRYR